MKNFTDKELIEIINTNKYDEELFKKADAIRRECYGTDVYIRGLIEFTNYCKNNCYYCGIRAGNTDTVRYRLTKEEILSCCEEGYSLGFRTFVLQGGEDPFFTDEKVCDIVSSIREKYPDCAITLSIGEKPKDSYKAYFSAGANRYLLRHETATDSHYNLLHPPKMSLDVRKACLYNLKEIGYQVGSGFMVGSPYQTTENLVADLRFLEDLSPDMIGIGPYMTHSETPFFDKPSGSLELTLRMLAILRIMFPYALLPATTALGSIHPEGREMGLKAGANVVMPNLSPIKNRKHYDIYENKIATGLEAAQNVKELKERFSNIGYHIVTSRGDVISH
ncbi:MAG: [Clostridia bacterium]|nr:[FeFe] hydrogenase H-cluster radical SAM maturase HydE [Clostridia bacterium]